MLNIIGQCQCDIVQIMVLTDKYNNNNNVSFKGQIFNFEGHIFSFWGSNFQFFKVNFSVSESVCGYI